MEITVEVPDDLAEAIAAPGQDPRRAALEALGLDAFRQGRISTFQLRRLLGIPSRWELDRFLKDHSVETYTAADFERDLATIRDEENSNTPAREK